MGQLARQRDMYRMMAEEAGTPATALSAPRTPPLSSGHPQVRSQALCCAVQVAGSVRFCGGAAFMSVIDDQATVVHGALPCQRGRGVERKVSWWRGQCALR